MVRGLVMLALAVTLLLISFNIPQLLLKKGDIKFDLLVSSNFPKLKGGILQNLVQCINIDGRYVYYKPELVCSFSQELLSIGHKCKKLPTGRELNSLNCLLVNNDEKKAELDQKL